MVDNELWLPLHRTITNVQPPSHLPPTTRNGGESNDNDNLSDNNEVKYSEEMEDSTDSEKGETLITQTLKHLNN